MDMSCKMCVYERVGVGVDLGYIFNFYFLFSVLFHFILDFFFVCLLSFAFCSHSHCVDKLRHFEFSDTEYRNIV